jgi:hypothetical protein
MTGLMSSQRGSANLTGPSSTTAGEWSRARCIPGSQLDQTSLKFWSHDACFAMMDMLLSQVSPRFFSGKTLQVV